MISHNSSIKQTSKMEIKVCILRNIDLNCLSRDIFQSSCMTSADGGLRYFHPCSVEVVGDVTNSCWGFLLSPHNVALTSCHDSDLLC